MNSKTHEYLIQFIAAVKTNEEVLRQPKTVFMRDAAIQRFEYTVELAWKVLKEIMREKGAKEIIFPKDVIKAAFQARLIENDHIWLDMIDTRNKTSHLYKESMAEDVYTELPKYLPVFKKLAADLG